MYLDYFDKLQFHEKNCHFCLQYFDRLQLHEKIAYKLEKGNVCFTLGWQVDRTALGIH